MLKPTKKLTKRQIKQDKFVTYYFKTQDFISAHSQYLLWGVIIVVLVIGLSFYFSSQSAKAEQNAGVELAKARIEFFAGNYENAISILTDLTGSFSGTESAKEGMFFLANAHFNLNRFDVAEEYFRLYLENNGDEVLAASALAGIAACYEEKGDYANAAETYRQAADEFSESFMAPNNLYDAARCFSLSGKKEEAANALQDLINKYNDAPIKNDAEVLLAELTS